MEYTSLRTKATHSLQSVKRLPHIFWSRPCDVSPCKFALTTPSKMGALDFLCLHPSQARAEWGISGSYLYSFGLWNFSYDTTDDGDQHFLGKARL